MGFVHIRLPGAPLTSGVVNSFRGRVVVYRFFGGWEHDRLGCGRWCWRASPRVQPRLQGMRVCTEGHFQHRGWEKASCSLTLDLASKKSSHCPLSGEESLCL